jgi:iron-sulfur cluster repair protein YtfE (RIC family)
MQYTLMLRRQHDELMAMAKELAALLDPQSLRVNGKPARDLLSRLGGTLKVHLAQEDKLLYPKLQNCGKKDVAALAARYVKEMGTLGQAFLEYSQRWNTAAAIQAGADAFAADSKKVLEALGRRVQRENDELYPMADGLAA